MLINFCKYLLVLFKTKISKLLHSNSSHFDITEDEKGIMVRNRLQEALVLLRQIKNDTWIDNFDERSVDIRCNLEEALILLRDLKNDAWKTKLRDKIHECLHCFYEF